MKLNKFKIFLISFFLMGIHLTVHAQIENENKTIKFKVIEDDFKVPEGLKLPAIKLPSIIKPQNPFKATDFSGLGENQSESLDITDDVDPSCEALRVDQCRYYNFFRKNR